MTLKKPSDALHVDFIQTPLGGAIGLTHCPGRRSLDAKGRQWDRDLASDVAALKQQDITAVVSLLAQEELQQHGAGDIGSLLDQAQMDWLQFPISDYGIPSAEVTRRWTQTVPQLLQYLQEGQKVVIHCAAGYGRTGMMTAALLVAMGVDAQTAIALVRAARPGTIETPEQEAFICNLQSASDQTIPPEPSP
jgi:ADP-ribosyl-[dinitrogen reductase] hydrolase